MLSIGNTKNSPPLYLSLIFNGEYKIQSFSDLFCVFYQQTFLRKQTLPIGRNHQTIIRNNIRLLMTTFLFNLSFHHRNNILRKHTKTTPRRTSDIHDSASGLSFSTATNLVSIYSRIVIFTTTAVALALTCSNLLVHTKVFNEMWNNRLFVACTRFHENLHNFTICQMMTLTAACSLNSTFYEQFDKNNTKFLSLNNLQSFETSN